MSRPRTEVRRRVARRRTGADRLYRRLSTGAGLLTLVILFLIGLFLVLQSLPAFRLMGWRFFTTQAWGLTGAHPTFGIAAVMYWTVVIALEAIIIAVPSSIAISLFINEYAPSGLSGSLVAFVDLLAAMPSIIFGLWGLVFVVPAFYYVSQWLTDNASFIPIFRTTVPNYEGSAAVTGLVLSLMVIPVCTSVMREVFSLTPPAEKEAAFALGATRWGMIRAVVLPFGVGGIVGGSMLGLGRALGETIMVALLVVPSFNISYHLLQQGANSVAALIALQFGGASPQLGIPALMAAGISLFALTLAVNFLGSLVVARSRSGSGVEI